jgi:hypothetical protein
MTFTKLDHVMVLTLFSPRRAELLNFYGQSPNLYAYIFFILLTTSGESPKFIHKFRWLFFVFCIATYVCCKLWALSCPCEQVEECPINSTAADNLNTKGWYDDVYWVGPRDDTYIVFTEESQATKFIWAIT